MSAYVPKRYQQSVLDSVAAYFREVQATRNADSAFYNLTLQLWGRGVAYRPIEGFDTAMPYFCLRVPTGGGKTWLAAQSVALVNAELLRNEFSVILWLVPSNTIREQTLAHCATAIIRITRRCAMPARSPCCRWMKPKASRARRWNRPPR